MAGPTPSPLQQVLSSWQARGAQASAAGLQPGAWQKLAQHDINNVMAGGTAMPATEVKTALLSQLAGKPILKEPSRPTGITAIPGNVASDVGGMITGFIPGIARYLYHLPSEATNTARAFTDPQYAQQQGYEQSSFSPSGLAAAARNVAKLPLLQPLPIVHTLAGLTTSQGRKDLQAHPVGAALDVLPVVADVGAAASIAAKGGEAASEGGALAALQEGSPVKAGFRGALNAAGKITGTDPNAALAQLSTNLGVSSAIRENLARPFSVIGRRAQRDAIHLYKTEVEPVVGKLPMEERAQLWQEAAHYDPRTQSAHLPDGTVQPISPEHVAILQKVAELNEQFLAKGESTDSLIRIPTGVDDTGKPTFSVYPTDDRVAETFRKVENQQRRVDNAHVHVATAADIVAEREAKLATRTGKVRSFIESDADFNARPEGPVGVDTVRAAIRPMIESFQHLDPREVFREYTNRILDGEVKRAAATRLAKDFDALQGETGLMAQLDESLANRDLLSARKAATGIAKILRHKAWDGFDTSTHLRAHISEIRDEMIGLSGRERSHGFAARMLSHATKELTDAQAKLQSHQEELATRQGTHLQTLTENPPANFHAHIQSLVRERAMDAARQLYQGTQLDDAIHTITHTPSTAAMAELIGADEFKAILNDSVNSWMELQRAGVDPIWMHHINDSKSAYEGVMNSRPLPDHLFGPSQYEKRVFNFTPGMQDIAAAVTGTGVELIRQEGTRQFVQDFIIKHFAKETGELHNSYMESLRDDPRIATETLPGRAQRELEKEWVPFDPADYGVGQRAKLGDATSLMIPKGVAKSLGMMMKDYKLPLTAAYDKTLNVYKFSVLTGPRHMIHVGVGGLTMAMLREPRTLLYLRDAARLIRNGEAPVDLMHNIYDLPTDKVFSYSAGKTMARHFIESVGDKAKALAKFEEFLASTERVATMLAVESKGLSRDVAMREALKVYIDMDGMAPIERTVIRNVFPFYAFTKHIFRYLFTYPVDHPIRAAILSRYGEMEQKDWTNGLPRKYQQLFFLGSPDKNGNVYSVDFKSINPFRSIANDFSLAGFISSLNPIITAPFAAAGVNTLSATPELYPALSYDTTTGTLTAKRRDVVPTLISQFIPEYGLVDHFINQTDRMKQLKANAPDAYRRQLFSALNLPFAQGEVNVPYEKEHTQIALYKAAQATLSGAKHSQNFEQLQRFNLVPQAGQLVTPDVVEARQRAIADALAKAGRSNINPNAAVAPLKANKRAGLFGLTKKSA